MSELIPPLPPEPAPDEPAAPPPPTDAWTSEPDGGVALPRDAASDLAWGLLDASAQHDVRPDGFAIPPAEERAALQRGDLAKLVFVLDPAPPSGPNAERMWVEIALVRSDGSYEGRLTNEPVVIPSLTRSTLIAFDPRHVAEITKGEVDRAFDVKLRAVVSTRALELPDPPAWVICDQPVTADDSGWSVTAGDEDEEYFDPQKPETLQAMTLAELVGRYPALAEVFQAGGGEWEYRPDRRRYERLKDS